MTYHPQAQESQAQPSVTYDTTFQTEPTREFSGALPPLPRGAEKYGAWYDHDAAEAAVNFFPDILCHTEAEWYGKPFILSPWQEQIVRQVFGWKRANGLRLIRQVYIEIPRKNGKTEFAAGIALLVMLFDREMKGQGYFLAASKEQANDTVFEKTRLMVGLSEGLRHDIEVNKTSLYCPELQASFKPLSSRAGTKQGFSPTFLLADELHVWPDGEVHEVVRKGMGARRQPLELLLTTAGEPGIGYGWQMHEYAENVLNGITINPTFLAVIFAADPKDDWRSPATWAKANPNLNVSVKQEFLEEMVMQAEGNARLIGDFKRYHLNIWNSETVAGIPMEQWDACPAIPVTLESLKGRTGFGGLDLSSTTDLCAFNFIAPFTTGKPGFDCFWHFWMPKQGLAERCKRDRVPYDKWIKEGWITATEGNVVDYDAIRAFLSGKIEHPLVGTPPVTSCVKIQELAFDRWGATHLATQLLGDGVNMVQLGQGYGSMSAPSKELLRLIGLAQLNHGGNPVARWMANCTIFINDGAENIKPDKPDRMRSIKRIDGIVATIDSLARAIVPREPVPGAPGVIFV